MKIEGVVYKFIVKGRRTLDHYDGLYKQSSHLVYGWAKLDTLNTEFPEWAWCYEWEDEEGKTKRLGRGWQKKPIWRDYPGGVKSWIEDLFQAKVFPRHMDALAQVFPQALPVERRSDEVTHWKRQVIHQEEKIQNALDNVKQFESWGSDGVLDEYFPQHTHSCHSWSGCQFIPICHEGVKAEPGDLYQIRQANHPERSEDE